MPENDRAILVMHHFDGLGNAECAAALGIEPKTASISSTPSRRTIASRAARAATCVHPAASLPMPEIGEVISARARLKRFD